MSAKKIPLMTAAACCLFHFAAQANDIEPGKEFYTAIKAANPIVLDGDLSEWSGAAVLADPRFSIPKGSGDDGELVNFEVYQGGDWTGPDDHTSAVRVVYDDDNVYFGFVVTDEYHENSANSAWDGDSVQLMIANETRDSQIALYNYALGGIEDDLTDIIVMHEAGPAFEDPAAATEAVVTRDSESKRTIYEIKLPKESLDLDELTGGVQFGLGMAINDGDEDTPGQKGWGGLGAHSIVFGKTPQETALVTLAMANDIEAGKEFYTAGLAPGEIVLDGELDDWVGVPVLSDPRFAIPKGIGSRGGGELSLFELHEGGVWTGPDDHTSAVQIAWDQDNVYFGFVVTDDYHENSANSAWDGDSVQLMIANNKQDTQVALYNYALGGIEDDLLDVIVMHEAGPAFEDPALATEAVVTRDSELKRTTYEIKLPKESLMLDTLEFGTMFGLGMAINDGDEDTPGQKGWGGLGAHSIVFGKTPQETALVTLGIPIPTGCFISAISTGATKLSFRGNDIDGCVVDPETTTLLIDGQPVELVATPATLGATDFTHTFPEPFATRSEHTFEIELRDTDGNIVTRETGPWTAPIHGVLTSDMQAKRVDKSKPGFLWRVFQNELYVHTSLTETELALAGELTDAAGEPLTENNADETLFGPAVGPGVVVGDADLIEFEIPTVINLSWIEGSVGNFGPDDQMPGVPGLNGVADGADAEIITFVEFPAGIVTMGVNSDDGFRVEGGLIDQPELMGEFDGARGATDSIFTFSVKEAGVYPIRVIWVNGGGDANIELFTVMEDGTKVLLNDTANGGLPAYRSAPTEFLITEIVRSGNDVDLTWQVKPGRYYAVDTSPDLLGWESIITEFPDGGATGELLSFTDTGVPLDAAELYYRVRQVPPPALLSTDFENGAEGWTASTDRGDIWELGTPNVEGLTMANSGTQAWGVNLEGDYAPGTFTFLRSPVVDVSNESSPKLSFFYYIDSTFEVEGGQLRFLNEAGETLAALEEIFSGQSEGWKPFTVRFPSAARGGKVIIEFAFLTDDDNDVGAGWYIDDVRID